MVQLGRNSSHLATAIKASLTAKKGGPPCTNKVGRSRHFPGVTHPNHLRAGSKPSGGASFFSLMTGRDACLTNQAPNSQAAKIKRCETHLCSTLQLSSLQRWRRSSSARQQLPKPDWEIFRVPAPKILPRLRFLLPREAPQ